jgi:hypothetical protein
MESEMFLQTGLDDPNQIELAEQIEVFAQAIFPPFCGAEANLFARAAHPVRIGSPRERQRFSLFEPGQAILQIARELWLITRRHDRKDLPIRIVADYLVKSFADQRAFFE